jgi:hypothetical protein
MTVAEPRPSVNNPADSRCIKARRLLAAGLVQVEEDGSYLVGSESLPGWWHIVTPRNGTHPAACTCRDYLHRQGPRGGRCAHLWAARFAEVQLRETQARTRAELGAQPPAPAESTTPETPTPPKRYRRDVKVIIRRPTVRASQVRLEEATRREERRQAGALRQLRCGTRADGWELATP